MTPVPDVGHDYIHAPAETVNPANGSLSIRIPVRMPASRGITLPFSFAYDSNGVNYAARRGVGALYWMTIGPHAGWSNTIPIRSVVEVTWNTTDAFGHRVSCAAWVDYVFQDANGDRHNLNLSVYNDPSGTGPCTYNTGDWPYGFDGLIATQGGEGPILATTTTSTAHVPGNVVVTDGDGTVFQFPTSVDTTTTPASITDRNGNVITIASSYVDTTGRTTLQDSGFATNPETVTVSGLAPYTLTWTTLSTPTLTTAITPLSGSCTAPAHLSWLASQAVSTITLPNGKSFSFTYDPIYGLVNKMTYPTGGYVRYVWGMYLQSEQGFETDRNGIWTCDMLYAVPAITDRYVSFDGSTEVLHQQFTYSPPVWSGDQWTSKQTKVTTYDLVRNTNFQTIYTYSGITVPDPPNTHDSPTNNVPVEHTVAYHDTNGALLRTVAKGWCNIRELCSEWTTLDNNLVSKTLYTYNANEKETERDDYDFGSGAPSSLLRKTVTNYAAFSGAHIVDLPSSVVRCSGAGNDAACNGVGTRAAETDFSYDQGTLQSTSVVQHVAAPGGTARGNLTTLTKQCFQGSNSCASGNATTTHVYYDTGQPSTMTDPKNNTTQYSYTDSYSPCGGTAPPSGASNAYLTQITYPQTNGVNHIESYCYDYMAGLLRSSTDENTQATSYAYADSFDRLTETDYPDGGKTTTSYNDAAPAPSVTTSRLLNTSGQYLTSVAVMDGMGLVAQTQLTSDPEGPDYTDTTYDGLGRVYTQSNPHRSGSSPTDGTTTFSYDALGRTTSVTLEDGSVTSIVYSGNCATATDPAGKSRKSCSDALGRLTGVWEDPTGLNYETDYGYDALDNLLSVVQAGSRQRSFVYDSLSRLVSATNPETGTISYSYDPNGNVVAKTAPAPNQTGSATVTTNFLYDPLNRVTQKSYSDGSTPTDRYGYDGVALTGCATAPPTLSDSYPIGHRTAMCDGAGAESRSHDTMGRTLTDLRATNGLTKSTVYTYLPYVDGSINSITYPSGRVMTLTTGTAERLVSVQDSSTGTYYATSAHYSPNDALSSLANGSSLISTLYYNNRLQPCRISVKSSGSAPANCADSTNVGNVLDYNYNFSLGAGDNGNVMGITNNRDNTRSQNFTYDSLNRIATAQTQTTGVTIPNSNCWGLTFGYDPWGNLLSSSTTGPSGCSEPLPLNVSVAPANQISGYCYDSAGNLLDQTTCPANPPHAYVYNAENQLISAGGVTYGYDGDGNRVEKPNGTIYWYGLGGQVLDETDLSGSTTNSSFHEYVYFNGQRIARRDSSNNADYYFADHLGTARVVTNAGGTILDDSDFYPFGGERPIVSSSGNNYKFTGKERDSESDLDFFGARYYSSSMGRFLSPDPLGGHLFDPQTLNKYVYVRDNPISLTDPTGLDLWLKGCGKKDTATCHKNYVGTWDKNHKHFTRTHIKGDQRENATLGPHGINVKYGGNTYQGVWDTNKGEQNAVDIAGSGALNPFTAEINGNCGGTCVFSGTLYNASGFGTNQQTLASASAVYNALNAPGSGYVRNAGFDAIDFFHAGDVSFRGYSDTDPDLLFSTHVPVPQPGSPQAASWNGYIHADRTYPYDDVVDFSIHAWSVVRSVIPH